MKPKRREEVLAAGSTAPGPVMRGGKPVRLVEYRGLLPEQPASFLGRLSRREKCDVYAILGTFREVRGLIGAARLLHLYLAEGPRAAARGRTTFREYALEKSSLVRDIAALRRKVNRLAASVSLMLPTVPHFNLEEIGYDEPALRVS